MVGDGAVWAIDPDDTVARIDPRSGRVVKTIKLHAGMLAAGAEGVWVLSDEGVARIDPARNRLGRRIRLVFGDAQDIAVGGRRGVGDRRPPRAAVADRRRAQQDRAHDRRRRRRVLRRLRCRRGLGRQLRRRDRVARRPAHEPRHRTCAGRRRPVAGGRRGCRLGQHRGRDPERDAASAGVQPDRLGRPRAGRADRLRPAAARPGLRRLVARRRRRDPARTPAARLPRRALQRRLPVVRRVDGAERQLGPAPLRRERQRLRARHVAGRADRPVQLVLRRGRPADAQPRGGRSGAGDQPDAAPTPG